MEENEKIKTEINLDNKSKVVEHKNNALNKINALIDKWLMNPNTVKKVDLFSYWLEEYSEALNFEDQFNPAMLKSYKRGEIVKANLGFNIGNEEGGLHYCVILDKNNSKHSGTVTIIPLTSRKLNKNVHPNSVLLGNNLYKELSKKYDILASQLRSEMIKLVNGEHKLEPQKVRKMAVKIELAEKLKEELRKIKDGSIALVNQITTISKQRIHNPQTSLDILSGIKISNENLTLIDNKVKELFIKQ